MKRLVLLAGALVVSGAAHAADDTEVKHNGEFRVRYYNDMTPSGIKDNPGNKSDITGRMKLGFTLRKGEDLQAHVGLIHNSTFGSDKANDATLYTAGYSGATANNLVLVNQAYGWWKAGEGYSIKAGRFNIDMGGGEFFSLSDYGSIPITHEGFKVGVDTDFANIDLFMVKDKELVAVQPLDSDPEQHNWIVSVDMKNMPEVVKTANLLFVNTNRSENTGAAGGGAAGSANMQHVGLTVGGDVSGFMYKAIAAFQSGIASKAGTTEQKAAGSMFDVMLGYGLPDTMGLKFWGNYHMDSGDDSAADDKNETYNPLYYDGHKYAGLMDMVGWGNLTYWNIGASIAPADDLTVGLGVFGFTKSKENATTTPTSRSGGTAVTGALASKAALGMEIDLWAQKKYGSNFAIDAHFGSFMPGEAYKDAAAKKEANIMQLMVMGTMNF